MAEQMGRLRPNTFPFFPLLRVHQTIRPGCRDHATARGKGPSGQMPDAIPVTRSRGLADLLPTSADLRPLSCLVDTDRGPPSDRPPGAYMPA